jgi:mono/diheme cytochrome c family protein
MIRKVVGARAATSTAPAANVPTRSASVAAGKRVYDANCAACHGNLAQGAAKAGITISIIEEQRGRQPPDLTDDQSDHGSSEGDLFRIIKRGLPPTMMPGFDGRIPDPEIWNVVSYLRSLRPLTRRAP